MNILCITPLKHLNGIYECLENQGNVIYKPNINLDNLKKYLIKNKSIDLIFCNPNKQNYMLDSYALNNSSVKIIFTASTGTNHIDTNFCKKKNILIKSYKNDKKIINKLPSTSELAFGLMISLIRNIPSSFNAVKKKLWDYEPFIGRELASLSIGIIGLGRLGKMMANYAKAFNMDVLYYDPLVNIKKFKKTSLKNLIKQVDVISLHVHVNSKTKYMINKNLLDINKKKLYIINTSRGEIVKEDDIYYCLKKNLISGYATDVLEDEFDNIEKSPIYKASKKGMNVIITPHIGGMTYEGSERAWKMAIKNISKLKKQLDL